MVKIVISAEKKGFGTGLKELRRYRDLFWLLAYRDYRVRYAQTFLGATWAFLQPLATILIFTLVFGYAINVDTKGIPYPLFAVTGMAAWTFFAYVLSNAGSSIVGAQQMIKKIYFPRLIIPLSKAIVGFVDYAICFLIIVCLFFYYGQIPSANLIYLPLFIIFTLLTSLAIGIWMSALTIRYRDFQHIIPFLVQIGLYATPVAYPTDMVVKNIPTWGSALFYANPMVGIVEGYRWCILGVGQIHDLSYISFVVVFILFLTGIFYFRRMERTMADIV